jgi:hypothetical protein
LILNEKINVLMVTIFCDISYNTFKPFDIATISCVGVVSVAPIRFAFGHILVLGRTSFSGYVMKKSTG